ncbi:MAG TPA: SMC-Scp complex subunit ScpB [Phycisphaerales bacterium]|nr:SMC-Scp complex subunit ScpB [Phycisphaerales bacterium]
MSRSRAQTTDAAQVAPVAQPVEGGGAAAPEISPELTAKVEALLISVDRALAAQRIAEAVGLLPKSGDGEEAAALSGKDVARAARTISMAIGVLNEQYHATNRAFRIEELSAGYRVMTLPAYAATVAEFHKSRQQTKLSRAAVESLAIIAYKQPITRAELESIRGVSCGEVLKSLLERRLITIRGRAEELGRPMLYGTTKQFLDTFGLSSIKDLPAPTDLKV